MKLSKLELVIVGSVLLVTLSTGVVAEVKELEIWTPSFFSPESTLYDIGEVYKGIYDEFEKETGVKLKYELTAGSPDIQKKAFASAKLGVNPDIILTDAQQIPALVKLGWIYPIDPFVTEDYLADYIPGTLEQCRYEGKLYGLEFYVSSRAFFYRKDFLEEAGLEAPVTWIDLYTAGQKLTKPGRWGIGFSAYYGTAAASTLQVLSHFLGFGGQVTDPDDRPVFDEPLNREALEWTYQHFSDMVNEYKMAPEAVLTWQDPEITAAMISDQLAMMFNSNSRIRDLVTGRPDIGEVLGASLVPMPKGYSGTADTGSWAWIITTPDPERQKLAWRLIEIAQEPEWLVKIDTEHWAVPARMSAWPLIIETGILQPEGVWKDLFRAYEIGGHTRPVIPYMSTFEEYLTLGLQEVIQGKISPQEAVDRLQEMCMEQWKEIQR